MSDVISPWSQAPPDPWLVAADLLDPRPDPYAADPVGFARDVLGFNAWSLQARIMEAVRDHPRVAVRSSHGPGKTATAAQIVLWFLKTHRNSRVITTAPTWQQVEQQLWREIRAAISRANERAGSPVFPPATVAKLELGEQWFALGLSTNEPERFQGHHATALLLVVDEASGVDERIFEAAEGFLTAEGARVLLIGNPTRVGDQFHRAFTTERASWHTIHISTFDTPNYTGETVPAEVARSLPHAGWAAERAKAWGETSPMYEIRVAGDFPSQASDAVVALHDVEAAQRRTVPVDEARAMVTIGCDVARYGDDETVIAERVGDRIRIVEKYVACPPGAQPTVHTAGLLLQHARNYPPAAVRFVIDDDGLGGGVTDVLRHQLSGDPHWERTVVTAFRGGERALDPDSYPNRRSEHWFAMRDRVGELDLDPDDQLAADLSAPTYRVEPGGQRRVERKDETKKRLGRSPDRADAVLLTLVPAGVGVVVTEPERPVTTSEWASAGSNPLTEQW